MPSPGNPFFRERISTVDLLVLTSLDQLLFLLWILFIFFYKTSYLNEEVNCTEASTSIRVPCLISLSLYHKHTHTPYTQGTMLYSRTSMWNSDINCNKFKSLTSWAKNCHKKYKSNGFPGSYTLADFNWSVTNKKLYKMEKII